MSLQVCGVSKSVVKGIQQGLVAQIHEFKNVIYEFPAGLDPLLFIKAVYLSTELGAKE